MPSTLALTLTVTFILFLLRLERKQNPTASYALWIPTIWMLLIVGKPLGIWTGTGGSSMDEGSALDRNVISVLLVLDMLILIRRRFNWATVIKNNRTLILLAGFMLVSTLWSDIPLIALKRWFREVFAAILMSFIVATESHPHQALTSLFRRVIYVHIPLSLCLIKYYSYLGVEYAPSDGGYMWVGVASQKNGLALLCAFAIFFLIWTFIRRWRGVDIPVTSYQIYMEVFVIILSIWLFMGPNHVLTYSSTSTAALALGLTALLCLLWLMRCNIKLERNILLPIFIIIVFLYGTYTPFAGGLSGINVASLLGRDQTLTGRTEIWAMLIPYAMNKLILGHGFSSFWNDELRATIYSTAHNGYLDIILSIGIIGLIFWSLFVINSCRKAQQEMIRNPDWGCFWFCIILMAVVHNIAESSMTSFANFMPVIVLFLNIIFQANDKVTNRHLAS